MVAGYYQYLPVVLRSSFPELRQRSNHIPEIENIPGQYQHIACYRQFIIFQVSAVFLEFHVQITHVLYLHLVDGIDGEDRIVRTSPTGTK